MSIAASYRGIQGQRPVCVIRVIPSAGHSDDDEAFALARIQPFQFRYHATALVKVAVQVLNEAMPRRW